MSLSRRALPALMTLALPGLAQAQAPWPSRPIRFVIPWPPGGLNDLVARAFNDKVSPILGQTIVNDFKAGAGGRIGVAEIARAAPDGYTIGMGNLGPLTIAPNLYPDMPYDVAKDLAPVMMFAASPLVLVAPASLPVNSLAELAARAKSMPGRMNYGSVGVGAPQHLTFELVAASEQMQLEHIPYRGNADSLIALLGGDIQVMFETLPTILPAIRDGRVKALAVTTPSRVPQLPDVPTLVESGHPGLEVASWYAVIAPARTPAPILDRLYEAYTQVATMPEVQRFLAEQGLIYLPNTRTNFAERITTESARWERIIRDRGITVN